MNGLQSPAPASDSQSGVHRLGRAGLGLALGLGLATAGLSAVASPSFAHDGSHPTSVLPAARSFEVLATGANEVDTVGSARGSVTLRLTVDPKAGTATFTDLTPKLLFEREDEFGPTAFHIHEGVAGTNGDVVVDMTEAANQGQAAGSVHVDPVLAAEIVEHPEAFYLNYHTITFPKGAVRGQLSEDAVAPHRARLKVRLNGLNEVAPVVGAPYGRGKVIIKLNSRTGKVAFRKLTAARVFGGIRPKVPTAVHIHQGPAGTSGDVIVDLSKKADAGQRRGVVWADPGVVQRIIDNPQNYYVNYHTEAFPEGAIRGQLAR
jgi:CHRD domain